MNKRVSTKVWNLANNIKSGISKNISWDEAWEIIASWGNIEYGVSISTDKKVVADIYINNQLVKELDIKNGYDFKEMDCDWPQVYSQTLEYIFNEGLIKKPRARRKDAKKIKESKPIINRTKLAQISKISENMSSNVSESEITKNTEVFEENADSLKKRLSNLSVKRNNYRKRGKDVTEIENEILKIRGQIKDFKKNNKK